MINAASNINWTSITHIDLKFIDSCLDFLIRIQSCQREATLTAITHQASGWQDDVTCAKSNTDIRNKRQSREFDLGSLATQAIRFSGARTDDIVGHITLIARWLSRILRRLVANKDLGTSEYDRLGMNNFIIFRAVARSFLWEVPRGAFAPGSVMGFANNLGPNGGDECLGHTIDGEPTFVTVAVVADTASRIADWNRCSAEVFFAPLGPDGPEYVVAVDVAF